MITISSYGVTGDFSTHFIFKLTNKENLSCFSKKILWLPVSDARLSRDNSTTAKWILIKRSRVMAVAVVFLGGLLELQWHFRWRVSVRKQKDNAKGKFFFFSLHLISDDLRTLGVLEGFQWGFDEDGLAWGVLNMLEMFCVWCQISSSRGCKQCIAGQLGKWDFFTDEIVNQRAECLHTQIVSFAAALHVLMPPKESPV